MATEKPGFETLKEKVIDAGRCCECGACVTACPKSIIEMKDSVPTLVGEDTKCGLCTKSCPRMIEDYRPVYAEVFGDAERDPALGVYLQAYALRNADEKVRKRSQDGGVVTGLLLHLLDTEKIEGAIVSGIDPENPWYPLPMVATTRKEIIAASKSRYTRSANLVALAEAIKERKLKQLAIVGTPCHIQAVQRMRLAPLKRVDRAVVMTIGLFCSETFRFDDLMQQKIVGELGVPLEKLRKLDIKGKLLVYPRGAKESLKIPLKDVAHWVEPSCHYCTDFASDFADISVGGAGTPSKWSTVLTRTERGQNLIEEMLAANRFLRQDITSEALDRLRRIARPKVARQPD
jgi:coenzyme F420 hydrogenase subunit beta